MKRGAEINFASGGIDIILKDPDAGELKIELRGTLIVALIASFYGPKNGKEGQH